MAIAIEANVRKSLIAASYVPTIQLYAIQKRQEGNVTILKNFSFLSP